MIKSIAIVSLSSGVLGEAFVQHEVQIGLRRLEERGLSVRFMPHALRGIEYIREHPAERAEDLLQALRDPTVDMILCAIGGDDTYRLAPYLSGRGELAAAGDAYVIPACKKCRDLVLALDRLDKALQGLRDLGIEV